MNDCHDIDIHDRLFLCNAAKWGGGIYVEKCRNIEIRRNVFLFNFALRDDPKTHYIELTRSGYFYTLIALRQNLKMIADHFFVEICGARNVDLFMITPSISSPMGLGSNSEAIGIKFGKFYSYLVDSSQFGFEPLLLNHMDKIYCYLPSIRGEDPDKRHLNQFFNCEAEIKGTIEQLYPLMMKKE